MLQIHPIIPVWLIVPLGLALLAVCVVGAVQRRGPRSGWVRRSLMVVLLAVIAIRPVTADEAMSTERMNANVFFVVDRTGSMNAEDYDGSRPRLDGVKSDMSRIMDMTEGARYSIISFDSSAASQLPLTTDAGAAKAWVDTLRTEDTQRSRGSNVDRPREVLEREVRAAKNEDPQSYVLVYVLSDGENTDGKESASFSPAAEAIDAGAVLGYGSAEGGRMKAQGRASDGAYIQDPVGGDGLSRIDEKTLSTIASQLGVEYLHRTSPRGDLDSTMQGLRLRPIEDQEEQSTPTFEDWYWIPAIALSLVGIWELAALTLRYPRRLDKSVVARELREKP